MIEKRCSKCKKIKPVSEFHKDGVLKSGYSSQCKLCKNSATNAWRRKHQKYVNARQRGYNKKHPEMTLKVRLRQRYGITLEEYDVMWKRQDGVCFVCRQVEIVKTTSGAIRRLCVDHDHKTGKIRGLLCQKCNKVLGIVDDSIEHLETLIDYLKEN